MACLSLKHYIYKCHYFIFKELLPEEVFNPVDRSNRKTSRTECVHEVSWLLALMKFSFLKLSNRHHTIFALHQRAFFTNLSPWQELRSTTNCNRNRFHFVSHTQEFTQHSCYYNTHSIHRPPHDGCRKSGDTTTKDEMEEMGGHGEVKAL